jgi:hypothetical protein
MGGSGKHSQKTHAGKKAKGRKPKAKKEAPKRSASGILKELPVNLGLMDSKKKRGFINQLSDLSTEELGKAFATNNKKLDNPKNDLELRNALIFGKMLEDATKKKTKKLAKKAALVTKIGARHTGAECAVIQKMHDLSSMTRRAGARHSHADQGMVQRIHDDCAGLGATCKALPAKDDLYHSQVLKEGDIEKGSAGSGNFGHDGRPGRLGGSSKGGGLRRIGAKKDTPPGRRKGEKKDIVKNPAKLSTALKTGILVSGKNIDKGLPVNQKSEKPLKKLEDLGLGNIDNNRFRLNKKGLDARLNLMKTDTDAALFAFNGNKSQASLFFRGEIGNTKNNTEKIELAKNSFKVKGTKNPKISQNSESIPIASGALTSSNIKKNGKNTVFKDEFGKSDVDKVVKRAGKFFAPRTGNAIKEVTPIFKATLTIKAQSDAPNYEPASTPQRCKNCRFFLGDPGRDYCELFDFTADQDYICDAWEAGRPDEIPGYVANKADLAALTEGVLKHRGLTY